MKAGTVHVAYLHPHETSTSFHLSLTGLLLHDLRNNRRIINGGGHSTSWCGAGRIPDGRNDLVRMFLDGPADWLFMVDSDMGFDPDIVDRLVDAADPVERPVVGGLCFGQRITGMGAGQSPQVTVFPTIYRYEPSSPESPFRVVAEYQRDSLVQCAATGGACLLIHRSALVKLGGNWFDLIAKADGHLGEDMSFCVRLAQHDIPLFVHTGAKTTHQKDAYLDEHLFLERSFPEPAADPVAVIVPALNRPGNVEPFVRSLRASTGLATAYFICDPHDTEQIDAVRASGAEVILNPAEHGTFAIKSNCGYRATTEPWLLFVGDDVVFRPGWYDRALRAAGDRFHLVATNDLLNGAVLAGKHATHPLMRRSWLDDDGASWDGPGTVAHEGYRHWYVDNEWTAKAMEDGVFVYAPDSVIEHLHPLAGKASDDATYAKGRKSVDRDRALWERRAKTSRKVLVGA